MSGTVVPFQTQRYKEEAGACARHGRARRGRSGPATREWGAKPVLPWAFPPADPSPIRLVGPHQECTVPVEAIPVSYGVGVRVRRVVVGCGAWGKIPILLEAHPGRVQCDKPGPHAVTSQYRAGHRISRTAPQFWASLSHQGMCSPRIT